MAMNVKVVSTLDNEVNDIRMATADTKPFTKIWAVACKKQVDSKCRTRFSTHFEPKFS